MKKITVVDRTSCVSYRTFLFLGGPAHGKKYPMAVYNRTCPTDLDIVLGVDCGDGTLKYNKRIFVSPEGFQHVIYCDSRLSEDEQNALIYEWANKKTIP